MMSNFLKILFDLLIVSILYLYCFGQFLLAPIEELSEVTNPSGPVSYSASLFQYSEIDPRGKINFLDRFYIFDPDLETQTLSSTLQSDFSAKAIEFCSYHAYEFQFFYRRSESKVVRLKCTFAHEHFVLSFFDSLVRHQNRGAIFHIFNIVLYNNDSRELHSFARQVVIYAKDTSVFTNGVVAKTYTISESSAASKFMQPILIFHSKTFNISRIYHDEKLALCLEDFPNLRFLIAFSGPRPCQMLVQDHMVPRLQAEDLKCEFPEISHEQEVKFLNT